MRISKATLFMGLLSLTATMECGLGGVQSPSGACMTPAYIEGCHAYGTSSSCLQCQFNYVKEGNICKYAPGSVDACCQSFSSSSGKCQKCAPGLALQDGACVESKVAGCLVKSPTGSCLNCCSKYALFGGQCIQKIPGCTGYSSTGDCTECESTWSLEGRMCIPKFMVDEGCHAPFVLQPNGQCGVPNCQVHYDFGCAECKQGFRLLPSGICSAGVIYGCDVYNMDGGCLKCKDIFTTSGNTCLPIGCLKARNDGVCTQCDASKGFSSTTDGSCRIQNCVVSSSSQCLVCERDYTEVRGGCAPNGVKPVCKTCRIDQYADNGECYERQPGCIEYSGPNCVACKEDMYMGQNRKCVPAKPGCLYKDGVCDSCRSPFRMGSDRQCFIEGCSRMGPRGCLDCPFPYISTANGACNLPNCLALEKGKCQKCQDGYRIISNGQCGVMDPQCNKFNFEGLCISCNSGYTFDASNKCVKADFGCNYVDGRCVSCRAPFEYNSKTMSCQIDGCLTYFLGGCQTCMAEYDLRYNSCNIPNCLVSVQGHCKECDPDYIFRSDGVCVNKDEFCFKYDDKGRCVQCAPKYFMSAKTQKCKLRSPGCQYDNQDNCVACDKPFYFDGVRCEIDGCLDLGFTGCKQCYYPMQVDQFGLCKIQNCVKSQGKVCTLCVTGYVPAEDGACQKEDPNCLVYAQGSSGCRKCMKGYFPDNRGDCQYADSHCSEFSKYGNCLNCDRIYFLNSMGICQVQDPFCEAYSKGQCVRCKDYSYLQHGFCLPNEKGCVKQVAIRGCLQCEDDYDFTGGTCTPKITRLSWNDLDMDFSMGFTDEERDKSAAVFTKGVTSLDNLKTAISEGEGQVFYSSCLNKKPHSFRVDDNLHPEGWTCEPRKGQFIGVRMDSTKTFYALDIQSLPANKLSKFAVEYAEDEKCQNFKLLEKYALGSATENGAIESFYITPVQAVCMRIVVEEGLPDIKFEFYFNDDDVSRDQLGSGSDQSHISSVIDQNVEDHSDGQQFVFAQDCIDQEQCWMGLEVCEPKKIKGFYLTPKAGSEGSINTMVVKYSVDGINYSCFSDCKEVSLDKNNRYVFSNLSALKVRLYPAKWTGKPSCTVTFDY